MERYGRPTTGRVLPQRTTCGQVVSSHYCAVHAASVESPEVMAFIVSGGVTGK